MRVLLVEDDEMIGDSLCQGLKRHGYVVNWVKDGNTAELCLKTEEYDLMLLDLGLPEQSGLSVLKRFRQSGGTLPVLILTARDDLSDRVDGLDTGADDYLTKPFEVKELEARMRALIRRSNGRADTMLSVGNIVLDPVTKHITVADKTLLLSAREFALMHALMERPGSVLSVRQLEEKLYGWNEEVESNAIEVHVYQLRKKLGNSIIRNIRGMGYTVSTP